MLAQSTCLATVEWQRTDRHYLDADDQMLCRLSHLYWQEWPEVETANVTEGCWLAKVRLCEWTIFAIEADQRLAISEAIGEALSACQIEKLSGFQLLLANAVQSVSNDSANGTFDIRALDLPIPQGVAIAYGQR
jgi:hypothetical protein